MPVKQNEERRSYDPRIDELCEDMADLKEKLEPVIEVWGALAGLVSVLKWVGTVAKWVATIATACGVLWLMLKYIVQAAMHRGG